MSVKILYLKLLLFTIIQCLSAHYIIERKVELSRPNSIEDYDVPRKTIPGVDGSSGSSDSSDEDDSEGVRTHLRGTVLKKIINKKQNKLKEEQPEIRSKDHWQQVTIYHSNGGNSDRKLEWTKNKSQRAELNKWTSKGNDPRYSTHEIHYQFESSHDHPVDAGVIDVGLSGNNRIIDDNYENNDENYANNIYKKYSVKLVMMLKKKDLKPTARDYILRLLKILKLSKLRNPGDLTLFLKMVKEGPIELVANLKSELAPEDDERNPLNIESEENDQVSEDELNQWNEGHDESNVNNIYKKWSVKLVMMLKKKNLKPTTRDYIIRLLEILKQSKLRNPGDLTLFLKMVKEGPIELVANIKSELAPEDDERNPLNIESIEIHHVREHSTVTHPDNSFNSHGWAENLSEDSHLRNNPVTIEGVDNFGSPENMYGEPSLYPPNDPQQLLINGIGDSRHQTKIDSVWFDIKYKDDYNPDYKINTELVQNSVWTINLPWQEIYSILHYYDISDVDNEIQQIEEELSYSILEVKHKEIVQGTAISPENRGNSLRMIFTTLYFDLKSVLGDLGFDISINDQNLNVLFYTFKEIILIIIKFLTTHGLSLRLIIKVILTLYEKLHVFEKPTLRHCVRKVYDLLIQITKSVIKIIMEYQ